MTKPCECNRPGWCARHNKQKTRHLWRLCKTREDYRALWDQQVVGPLRKAKQYLTARAKWKSAGKPVRSKEEIDKLFAICEACPKFEPAQRGQKKGACRLCGCSVSSRVRALFNKLRWATENCPLNKW